MDECDDRPSPFLRIGKWILNLNKIAQIEFGVDQGPFAVVWFAHTSPNLWMRLQGAEAEALRDAMAEFVDERCGDDEIEFKVSD